MKHKKIIQSCEELEIIITTYYPKIFKFLYKRTLNEDLSKDLTQETFYQFVRSIDRYEEGGKLLNYLYKIALNLFYDHTREKKVDSLEDKYLLIHDNNHNAKYIFDKKEESLILRRWILKLPANLQDLIVLRFDEQLKYKDIARITGINVSTVKSQTKLALSLLKQYAKEDHYER